MSNHIELRHIVKRFNNRTVLDGISLEFPVNSITALIGVNGAGKTTLLKCIAGLISYEGCITLQGVNYESQQNTGQLGSYIQDVPSLYPYMTGYEYLSFCTAVVSPTTTQVEVDSLLNDVGLSASEAATPISAYSRGMKQRLIIAQHLISDSGFLLFDEPTSALDPIARVEILNTIRRLKERSTILISTHDIESIVEVADRIVVIDKGRILYSNSLDSFYGESSGYLHIRFISPPVFDVISAVFEGIVKEEEIVLSENLLTLAKPILLNEIITVQKRLAEQGVYFHSFSNQMSIKAKLSEIISEGNYGHFTT